MCCDRAINPDAIDNGVNAFAFKLKKASDMPCVAATVVELPINLILFSLQRFSNLSKRFPSYTAPRSLASALSFRSRILLKDEKVA